MATKLSNKTNTRLNLFTKEGLSALGRCKSVCNSRGVPTGSPSGSDREHSDDPGLGIPRLPKSGSIPILEELKCLSCGMPFDSRADQVMHYKLDWHKYNVKRRVSGRNPISQEDFERISESISSLSGSESSEEEENSKLSPRAQRRHHTAHKNLIFFSTQDNHVYGVHPVILYHPKNTPDVASHLVCMVGELVASGSKTTWVVLMKAGGHFAGAVFRGNECIQHKTFHRYTVRAKRGTAQSVRDSKSKGSQPKSAGATLRRYNEAALEEDIAKLLLEWKKYIDEAMAVFVRVPAHGRTSFFTGPLQKDDPRLRNIPLITRRPTLKEVKRVHQVLSTIYDFGIVEPDSSSEDEDVGHLATLDNKIADQLPSIVVTSGTVERRASQNLSDDSDDEEKISTSRARTKRKKDRYKVFQEEEEDNKPRGISKEILQICKISTMDIKERIADVLKCHNVLPRANQGEIANIDFTSSESHSPLLNEKYQSEEKDKQKGNLGLNEQFVFEKGSSLKTLLHVVSSLGYSDIVWILLEYGADPTIKDGSGKVAYQLSKDRKTRDEFRKFMAEYPDLYDYTLAMIPSALTNEMEAARREKQAERNRVKKKQKREREKASKEVAEQKRIVEEQKKVEHHLSEREKRVLAAERRILKDTPHATSVLSAAGVCSFCEKSLAGVVPFTKFDFKFCSLDCVKQYYILSTELK